MIDDESRARCIRKRDEIFIELTRRIVSGGITRCHGFHPPDSEEEIFREAIGDSINASWRLSK